MWAIEHMLDPEIRSQIRNMHMQKVGSTLGNLQAAGYGKPEINAVVRALVRCYSISARAPSIDVLGTVYDPIRRIDEAGLVRVRCGRTGGSGHRSVPEGVTPDGREHCTG